MTLCLGALHRGRALDAVRRAWSERLRRLAEGRLELLVREETEDRVRAVLRPHRFQKVPHRRLGALIKEALGPEREEHAELWLLEPGDVEPGALRLDGASWTHCLDAIRRPATRQIRLWSPLVCPGRTRRGLERQGRELGLELRETEAWALMAVPRRRPLPPPPPPWKGNYGW